MRDTPEIPIPESEDRSLKGRFNRLRRERTPLMIVGVAVIALGFGAVMFLNGGKVETDNAYVQASRAPVAASMSGRIVEIRIRDNDRVDAGQTLFVLDSDTAEAQLREAEAALGAARARAQEMKSQYAANVASYRQSQEAVSYARKQNARERALQKEGLSAAQTVETADYNTTEAQRQAERASAAAAASLAALGANPTRSVEDYPMVRQAAARFESARAALDKTVVKALQPGIVTRVDQVQVGTYVSEGQPLFWMVSGQPYVEANFKESQLENMRVGQEATVKVDAFPNAKLKARVASFSPGTGAVFSAIPAQNATGNWVKVVQRLPVRLNLIDPPKDLPISAGLSAHVAVDTRSQGVPLRGRD